MLQQSLSGFKFPAKKIVPFYMTLTYFLYSNDGLLSLDCDDDVNVELIWLPSEIKIKKLEVIEQK